MNDKQRIDRDGRYLCFECGGVMAGPQRSGLSISWQCDRCKVAVATTDEAKLASEADDTEVLDGDALDQLFDEFDEDN